MDEDACARSGVAVTRRRTTLATIVMLLIAASWFSVARNAPQPSRSVLEHTVEQVPVPGAAHPVRIDRSGSVLCLIPIPFGPQECPHDDMLFKSTGTASPEAYKAQWEDALSRSGWTQHAPDPSVQDAP
jgi:hypothetical protein